MSQIIADDNLMAQLNGFKETVEVREASGRLLGRFVPQAAYKKWLYAWANSLFTDEEIESASAESRTLPFKTLNQILTELGHHELRGGMESREGATRSDS